MAHALAASVATHLLAVGGVVAVVLGGSRARGTETSESDVDLGLYYDPASPPSIEALNALARALDDRHPSDAVTRFGAWGPWINGGAWLTIEGQRVDWLFRDLARIRRVVAECRAGRPEIAYQVGHPHAFVSSIYLGELDCCVPLGDPAGEIAELKRLVRPYPPLLRRALIDRFLDEAAFSLHGAEKGLAHEDVVYVTGCLYRSLASLTQVLFAVNERYCTNEKGALREVERFARVPDGFAQTTSRVLGAAGTTPDALRESIATVDRLVAGVRALAA